MDDLQQELNKGVKQLMAVSSTIQERLKETANRELVLADLDKKIRENATKAQSKIVFDVGGKRFATSKDTLLRFKDTYFYALFLREEWKPDSDDEYFIDRSPKHFGTILDFMRFGTIDFSDHSASEMKQIFQELDYYQLEQHLPNFNESILMNPAYQERVGTWVGKHKRWTLAYRATRDGFDAATFHRLCDNKGESVTVVNANGHLFGGYSPISWNSLGQYQTSSESFLFTLTNPHKIPPTKYLCTTASNSTYCQASYGPTFGGGHDLHINNCTASINFPNGYADTTGKSSTTFAGQSSFQLTDYEVFVKFI